MGLGVMVVLFAAFIAGAIWFRQAIDSLPSEGWRRKAQRTIFDGSVAALHDSDPDFSLDAFRERIRTVVRNYAEARRARDASALSMFASDSLVERSAFEWRLTDAPDLNLQTIEFDHVEHGEFADRIHARLSFRDRVEIWTFQRRPGARTLSGKGLFEGACPNCGGAATLNATCKACGAWLRSGEQDWVLVEITQATDWWGEHEVSGEGGLRAIDPEFYSRMVEDRAAAIFWRYLHAIHSGDFASLKAVATDAFLSKALSKHEVKPFLRSVDALAVVAGTDADRVLFSIRWENGKDFRGDVYVFARPKGVRTDRRRWLTSLHCHACGAPERDKESTPCGYCGAARTADWKLEEILHPVDGEHPRLSRLFVEAHEAERSIRTSPTRAPWMEGGCSDWHHAWNELQILVAEKGVEAERLLFSLARSRMVPVGLIGIGLFNSRHVRKRQAAPLPPKEAETILCCFAIPALRRDRFPLWTYKALIAAGAILGLDRASVKRVLKAERARWKGT